MGQAINDAERGVPGVIVTIVGQGHRVAVPSGLDGKFSIPPLPEGSYDISIDEDSLPAGYTTASAITERVSLKTDVPARAIFRLRAIRNVSGRVLTYDRALGKDVPVVGAAVVLAELGLQKVTDADGRYIFRELPSGMYVVAVEYQGQTTRKMVTVGQEPSQQNNVDFLVGAK